MFKKFFFGVLSLAFIALLLFYQYKEPYERYKFYKGVPEGGGFNIRNGIESFQRVFDRDPVDIHEFVEWYNLNYSPTAVPNYLIYDTAQFEFMIRGADLCLYSFGVDGMDDQMGKVIHWSEVRFKHIWKRGIDVEIMCVPSANKIVEL